MPYKLDEVDLRIISSLTKDARMTVTRIAKEAGVSRPTAISRLNKLGKNNVVRLGACVNVLELGFKLALMALKTKSTRARHKLETKLVLCPRVLMLMQTDGNPEYLALIYSENTETLVSVVECVKDISDTEMIWWHRSKLPLLPEAFDLKIFPRKHELAPCGKKCGECSSYQNQECLGCPAVIEYKGPL